VLAHGVKTSIKGDLATQHLQGINTADGVGGAACIPSQAVNSHILPGPRRADTQKFKRRSFPRESKLMEVIGKDAEHGLHVFEVAGVQKAVISPNLS
jgi:hypothetical protein